MSTAVDFTVSVPDLLFTDAYDGAKQRRLMQELTDFANSYNAFVKNAKGPAGTAVGIFQQAFGTGWIQFCGPNNQLDGDVNLQFGTLLPNPTGVAGPCLFMGSGGGAGVNVTFCQIMDQAFDDVTPGNDMIVTAGETQPAGTARGGNYTTIGGGSFGGMGGANTVQGGTSLHGAGGFAILLGGNNTDKTQPPGDAFVIAGEVGASGGVVHLVATKPTGSTAYGDVRVRFNSDIGIQFFPIGAPSGGGIGVGMLIDKGGGLGLPGQPLVSGGDLSGASMNWFSGGFTGDIPSGHTIHVASGLITGYT